MSRRNKWIVWGVVAGIVLAVLGYFLYTLRGGWNILETDDKMGVVFVEFGRLLNDPDVRHSDTQSMEERLLQAMQREHRPDALVDAWGWPIRFAVEKLDEHKVAITIESPGPDGEFGTDDDVAWKPPFTVFDIVDDL